MKNNQRKSMTSLPVICRILFALYLYFAMTPGTLYAQWNTNTSVNLLISTLSTADMQGAPTTDGKTWIAFYVQNGSNYDMRAQLIDANGYKLLGSDGILVDNETSGSATYVYNVCVDASNNFIIAYQDERSGSLQSVVYKISEAGTQLWGQHGIVLGGGLAPYPAALSNGEVIVAWSGDAGNTLNLQKITTTGTPAWSTPIQVKVGAASTSRGQVIANSGGNFTMVYQKGNMYTTLYAQRFSNSGTALYQPLQICSQTTASYRYYSVIAEADTTYVGYYSSVGNRFNSFLQRVNPDGTIPWGMNGSAFNTSVGTNDSYQGETSINMTPGSNYVWSVCNFSNPNQTVYGVYVQKFLKTSGARQFTDQAKVVYGISSSTDQRCGDLAVISDNPMFTSYNSTEKIFATRLDADGNFVWPGNRIEVSSTTASAAVPKMRYVFTPDGPNRCACTWTEDRGSGYMGFAQGVSVGGLVGLKVSTQGSVPATITTNAGTLQMVATVFPSTANQSVNWSIVHGTGMATINSTGLVTGVSNGTVYAKATAVQDSTVADSLLITLSSQTAQPPSVITMAATDLTTTGATLNGTVNANDLATAASFDWGLTPAYGNTLNASPASVSGSTVTPVAATLTGLTSNTTYHFRVRGSSAAGPSTGSDLTFTTSFGVGLSEKNSLKVDIYPIPNNGQFTVSVSNGYSGLLTLDAYDNLGSRVQTNRNISIKSGTAVVDFRSVPAGFYTIVLTGDGIKFTRKMLIKK